MPVPDNHASKFAPSWWTDRRRRDYFVDADNLVQLRPGSETARRLENGLRAMAGAYAARIAGESVH